MEQKGTGQVFACKPESGDIYMVRLNDYDSLNPDNISDIVF